MLKAQARPVHLYMEANPNPNSLKFVANFMLVEEGVSYDFPDAASAGASQLAKELFNFAAVQRVFIASNFVTITKSEDAEWAEVQTIFRDHIRQYLESGQQAVQVLTDKDPLFDENDSEIVKKNKGLSAVSQKDFKPQVRLRIIKLILTYTELLKPKLVFASNLFS